MTEASEETTAVESAETKGVKTKKTVSGQAGTAHTNGTPGKENNKKTNVKSKRKESPPAAGPKRAKVAKLDAQTVKAAVKKSDQSKASKAAKPDGKKLEKKNATKMKPRIKKNRIGKNKFNKLKKMLNKQDDVWFCTRCVQVCVIRAERCIRNVQLEKEAPFLFVWQISLCVCWFNCRVGTMLKNLWDQNTF